MSEFAVKTETTLKTMQCGTCGVSHAIPVVMFDRCYEEGGFWHCPNGHQRGYSEGSICKQLEKEKKRREWAEKNSLACVDEINALSRQLSAQKGVNTRMKNRAKTLPAIRPGLVNY